MVFERVTLPADAEVEFRRSRPRSYLALHNLTLLDGETRVEGIGDITRRDLKGCLTYLPASVEISGWSQYGKAANSYVSLEFEAESLSEETSIMGALGRIESMVYFENSAIRQTMSKIDQTMKDNQPFSNLYLDHLGMSAVLELLSLEHSSGEQPGGGHLTQGQLRLVREFVMDNIGGDITIEQMAKVLGLSKFYFSRLFLASAGVSPYRYVMQCRVEVAKGELGSSKHPIKSVARSLGFNNASQFSQFFKKEVGMTPLRYRKERLE